MQEHEIMHVLCALGITPRYVGFRFLLYAISLIQQNKAALNHIVHDVYCPVAEHFQVDWHNVEYNLRTLTYHAWKTDKALLMRILGYPLYASPSVSQFIEGIALYTMQRI